MDEATEGTGDPGLYTLGREDDHALLEGAGAAGGATAILEGEAALLDLLEGAPLPGVLEAAAFEYEYEPEPGVYPNFKTDSLYNREAPEPVVTFAIGGVLMFVAAIMWWRRMRKLRRRRGGDLAGKQWIQAALACALDNDEPGYTIVSYAASSMLVLGGIQMDFQTSWLSIVGIYFATSMGDTVRTLLALSSYKSLEDKALLKDMDHGGAAHKGVVHGQEESADFHKIEISPSNIYEDIGRGKEVVSMVFVMQVLFIVLVCIDIYNSEPKCMDGTAGCPIGRTLGSYLMYVVGIFLACVYMLGPKTDYGKSEQNPAFWLVLLLAMKGEGYKILWENPMDCPVHSAKGYSLLDDEDGNIILGDDGEPKQYHCRHLKRNDFRIWRRFIESYIVNGVGYHILVHALPAQVSMQSSIMGIVFRAVGMMYLVDLDDSRGMTLTITRDATRPVDPKEDPRARSGRLRRSFTRDATRPPVDPKEAPRSLAEGGAPPMAFNFDNYKMSQIGAPASGGADPAADADALRTQIQEVIDQAHSEIDLLRECGPKKEAPKEEPPTRRTSRKIGSDSVLLNVIGFGVTGLGGSGPRSGEGLGGSVGGSVGDATTHSEVVALTTEIDTLKMEIASLRASAVAIQADGDLEQNGAGKTQLVRLKDSAAAYDYTPFAADAASLLAVADIPLADRGKFASFLEVVTPPPPPETDLEAPSPAAASPSKQFDKKEELVVDDDLRGYHDHVKVLNSDVERNGTGYHVKVLNSDIERTGTSSTSLSSLEASDGEVDKAKGMGMTVGGMAVEWFETSQHSVS